MFKYKLKLKNLIVGNIYRELDEGKPFLLCTAPKHDPSNFWWKFEGLNSEKMTNYYYNDLYLDLITFEKIG